MRVVRVLGVNKAFNRKVRTRPLPLQRTELGSLHSATFPWSRVHAKRRFSKSFPISYCQLHRTHRGKLSFESFPIMNSLQTRGRQFLSHSSHLGPVYLKLDNKHFTTITGYNPRGKAFHSNHLLSDSLTPFCAGGSNPLQGEHRQNWNMLLV